MSPASSRSSPVVETVGGQVTNLKVSLETYLATFTTIAWIAIGARRDLLFAPVLAASESGCTVSNKRFAAALAAFIALTGCAALEAKPKPAPPIFVNEDPYPSTYVRYPGVLTVIRHATVFDGDGRRYDNGTVVFADGVVQAVGGPELASPAGALEIDGTGKWVTPGIIDVHSHLGDYPSPGVRRQFRRQRSNIAGAARSLGRAQRLAAGPRLFARADQRRSHYAADPPRIGEPVRRRSVVVKNVPARTTQGMKFPGAPYGLKMACGENPKRVYGSRAPCRRPGWAISRLRVRPGSRRRLYKRKWDKYYKNGGDMPERDLAMDTLKGVLEGKILVHNHCYRADEMANMIDMSKEFGYHIAAFHHAVEAYKIADLLRDNDICAVMWADWYGFKMEAYDAIKENIPLVHNSGACAMVHSDDQNGIQRLNQEVAKALADGRRAGINVPDEVAWEWLSRNPAKALRNPRQDRHSDARQDGRRGAVERQPYSDYTRPERVWIDGALMYDANDPKRRPVSDFELGQPGEGDVK